MTSEPSELAASLISRANGQNGHVPPDDPRLETVRQQAARFGVEVEELQELLPLLNKRELEELDRLLNAWTPQPHQIPPEGDWWLLWLMLGGRGSGKTDAMAHYVTQHVLGPPCLESLPGGHRIAIIAPNLGDAVEACVTGPSGLKAHSGGIKFKTQGGLHIVWPNGSEGKLFGASFPEDVERLRAGGNRSMAPGTLIQTERGPVPIERVMAGERVWTRNGLRRVLATWDHGARPYWRLETDLGTVITTPDHKFWTRRGWIEAQFLKPSDNIVGCRPIAGGTGIATHATRTATTHGARAATGARFTGMFGKQRTARSRKATKSTIGSTTTETPRTSSGWNASPWRNIAERTSSTSAVFARRGLTVEQQDRSARSAANAGAKHSAQVLLPRGSALRYALMRSTEPLRQGEPTAKARASFAERSTESVLDPRPRLVQGR